MRIYLSGKITDNKNYLDDFEKAREEVLKIYPAAEIVNPALISIAYPNGSWNDYMAICKIMLNRCHIICMLPNWRNSKGAIKERMWATGRQKRIIYL